MLGISLYLFKVKILVSLFVELMFGLVFLNRAMTPFDYWSFAIDDSKKSSRVRIVVRSANVVEVGVRRNGNIVS